MPDTKLTPKQELQSECPDNCAHCESVRAGAVEGMSAEQSDWEHIWSAISKLESQISRNPSLPESYSTIVKQAFSSVRTLQRKVGELREERDALKGKLETEKIMVQEVVKRAERAESAEAEALELLGVMYGWAKYGEESDPWYYSEEQAPGWKADSERASKLLGFKLKAKP